ncbi:MAG TPA: 4-hydroxy-tetrahydrodipicolinate reductase, partial [Armatimonadota bacterium]|nr:4-hydroxy-tetrahydrodipicolinate reductase [Armatimonadota bacterium]
MSVRVAVAGAAGRMGRTVVKAVHDDRDTELVALVDVACVGLSATELAGVGSPGTVVTDDLEAALRTSEAEVLVDFTRASSGFPNVLTALRAGVSPVIGTTGMSAEQVDEIRKAAETAGVGAFLAPNFAIGAVLMMLFARQAAKYLPEVEIIEFHGPQKVDAPSGTAMRTLDFILEGRGEPTAVRPEREEFKVEGARGGDVQGVHVHSVRLPGYVAHQECIFGGLGQTLTVRHDSMDRVSFMPGVLLACKKVRELKGLVIGL